MSEDADRIGQAPAMMGSDRIAAHRSEGVLDAVRVAMEAGGVPDRPRRSRAHAGTTLCRGYRQRPRVAGRPRSVVRGLAFLAAFLLLPQLSLASAGGNDEVPNEIQVGVHAVAAQATVSAGATVPVDVIYEVPPDAHIQQNDFFYANAAEGEPFTLEQPVLPKADLFEGDPVYRGKTTVRYTARISPKLTPGRHVLHIAAGYQACIEKPIFACYPPADLTLELPVEVIAGTGGAEDAGIAGGATGGTGPGSGAPETGSAAPGGSGGPTALSSAPDAASGGVATSSAGGPSSRQPASVASSGLAGKLQEALARRSLLAFLIVFLGGIATSFTPCVYPMIPITISYIGGRSRSKLGGFFLSVFFVLGIALTYSTLGVVAATSGALFGSAMQSTPVLIVVSVIFFAMGASMLGAFDLALPSGMQTKLQSGPRAGILGALFMGAVTGLVASPCVGPVVVVLLTWVAQIGSIGLGFLLLFTFAVGLGVLFLVIGTFAGALNALPQAGEWMDTIKHVFGVILIAMGIYYLRPLIGPALTWIAAGILLVLVGTFLGAFRPVLEDPARSLLLRKGFGIVFLLTGGFVLLVGLARYADLPIGAGIPTGGPGASLQAAADPVQREGLGWTFDDSAGLSEARTDGKPAVIDFYADWCAACRELDEKTWSDPDIRDEGHRFVAIKMDLTKKNEANARKQAEYGVPGLPTVIFYDSSGREAHRFFGFKPASEVLALMREVH